jgi:hypothetical protein
MVHQVTNAFRKLPPWAEAIIVLGSTFGVLIYSQLHSGRSSDLGSGPVTFTNSLLVGLMLWELAVLAILGTFLVLRGWRLADADLSISWPQIKGGLWLFVGTLLLYWLAGTILVLLFSDLTASASNLKYKTHVSIAAVIAISIINPFYEELTTVLYLFKRLTWMRPATLIIMSASLRAMVHAYQGAFAMLMVAVLGTVFATYYARQRRLLPLIVAHAIFDFLGFMVSLS